MTGWRTSMCVAALATLAAGAAAAPYVPQSDNVVLEVKCVEPIVKDHFVG
mgnify:CR=1 FL=1